MPRSAIHIHFSRQARFHGQTARERLGAAIVALAAALGAPGVGAAELGDITVKSYIGQPLAADIELTSLDGDDRSSLQVRSAPVDVYQLANVAMNPALKNASVSVVQRNQRLYVHVASLRPIEAGYVHLFLELVSAKGSEVRTTTVWLAPNPLPPAPLPAPLPPAVVLAAEPAQKPAPAPALPAKLVKTSLAAAPRIESAPQAREEQKSAPKPVPKQAPKPVEPALPKAEARTETKTEHKTEPKQEAKQEAKQEIRGPAGKLAEVKRAAVLPAPMHPAQAASPKPALSCSSPDAGADKECTALDRKNAALAAKLVELEGKIQALQKALAPVPAGSASTAPADAAHAAKAAPAPAPKLAPVPKVAPTKELKPEAPVAEGSKVSGAEPLAILVPKLAEPRPLVQLKPKPLVPLTPLKPRQAAPEPEQSEGMSPRLLLGGGTALFLLLIGTCVHFYSRFRKKAAQILQTGRAEQANRETPQGEPEV
jgi:pilus assembly protein FimV